MLLAGIQQCDIDKIFQYRHEDKRQKNSAGAKRRT